jgi:hypothetical protein
VSVARDYGQHPAVWLGQPDLVGAYCWTVWAHRLAHGEAEARKAAARR